MCGGGGEWVGGGVGYSKWMNPHTHCSAHPLCGVGVSGWGCECEWGCGLQQVDESPHPLRFPPTAVPTHCTENTCS